MFNVRCSPSILRYLKRHLRAAHELICPPLQSLSIALVGDSKMSSLHLQFLNLPGPTDVLTFPLETNRTGQTLSGEVVICVPQARRRCKKSPQNLQKELLLYALHGMLHLSGFDDRTESDFKRMHRMEDQILGQLGVGPVFYPGNPGDD